MSNYIKETKHPVTGKCEEAEWLDDYFGKHMYGVRFPDGKIFNPEETEIIDRLSTPQPKEDIVEVWERKDNESGCITANGILMCRCGKCKSGDYKLPEDITPPSEGEEEWEKEFDKRFITQIKFGGFPREGLLDFIRSAILSDRQRAVREIENKKFKTSGVEDTGRSEEDIFNEGLETAQSIIQDEK